MKQQIAWLMEQLKLSKRKQYGTSSEKSDYEQMRLFNEAEVTADLSDDDPSDEEVKAYKRKKPRTIDRLPPDLPVEIIEHELPEEERFCPECGGALHIMGCETRDELKLIPAKASITRHVRHTYACRNCEKNAEQPVFVKAEIPKPVIKGSFASPEAIAHIASQKFVMGLPLYRQEKDWERNEIYLSRQTMSNWLIRSAEDWLKPVYERLHQLLCASECLHADETTLQVLKEPNREAESRSYMWLYRTSGDAKHSIVLYEYQTSRSGAHPKAFLGDFKGYLHTDGWEEYRRRLPDDITIIGCWAHCRRRYEAAYKALAANDRPGSETLRGLQFCDRLFALERIYNKLPADDLFHARRLAREERSRPVMDGFFAWAEKLDPSVNPNTLLGKAIRYTLNQRLWLERVLLDGRLELSNNRAERSIKPFVIGRKNFLFANTPKGANASAMIYSIVETAKENGVNPFDYLSALFRKAPNMPENAIIIDNLLPWNLCTGI